MGKISNKVIPKRQSSGFNLRIKAPKAILPSKFKKSHQPVTIQNPDLETTWKEILLQSGFQLTDNLVEIRSSHSKKEGKGWTAKLDDKIREFVGNFKRKRNNYLVQVEVVVPAAVKDDDGGDNCGPRDFKIDIGDVKLEVIGDGEEGEGQGGFQVPLIMAIRSVRQEIVEAEGGEMEEEGEEATEEKVQNNFERMSNVFLLRVSKELEELKRNSVGWQRFLKRAPLCSRFAQDVLDA